MEELNEIETRMEQIQKETETADEERMTAAVRGVTYTLGSPLDVVLTEADPGTRRITFAPLISAGGGSD